MKNCNPVITAKEDSAQK